MDRAAVTPEQDSRMTTGPRTLKWCNINELGGVFLTPLQIIPNERGQVLHGLRAHDPGFAGFGEAYFSTAMSGLIKGWKKHTRMTLNLIVPTGIVEFALYDNRDPASSRLARVNLSPENYARLTVPPNIWVAFTGGSESLNLLLNIANIPHDPSEAENRAAGESGLPCFSDCFSSTAESFVNKNCER